jgi:hypothetical protein
VHDPYRDVGMDQPQYNDKPDPTRSARVKRGWDTRRKHQHDRHAIGEHPFDSALAALYAERERINAAIAALETLKVSRA